MSFNKILNIKFIGLLVREIFVTTFIEYYIVAGSAIM